MKKIICLFFALILVFPLVLPCLAANESDGGEIDNAFDISKTAIEDDFKYAFGGSLNILNYPADLSAGSVSDDDNVFLITCTEYKYSKNGFEMYFYFYNPTNKPLSTTSPNNKIQIKSNVLGDDFNKFDLEFVSSYKTNLITKWKIKDWKGKFQYKPSTNERHYEISGVELQTKNYTAATEYAVAQQYIFRENSKGFLTQQYTDSMIIKSDVMHTYYRYYTDDYNECVDLRSVVFNIPNDVIDEYGNLEKLRCEWEEVKCYPILVTNKPDIHNLFKNYVLNPKTNFGVSIYYDMFYAETETPTNTKWFNSSVGVKRQHHEWNSLKNYDFLGGSFLVPGEWESYQLLISSDEMMKYQDKLGWYDWNFQSIDKSNFGTNSKTFDVYTTKSLNHFYLPETNMLVFASTLFRLFNEDFGKTVTNYNALEKVTDSSFKLTDEKFAYQYNVLQDDVAKIKEFREEGKTMFILHYTVTDYQAHNVYFADETKDGDYAGLDDDQSSMIAEMVGIRNFDIIEGEFFKSGVRTVIPFVSSPSNAMTGITAPFVPRDPLEDFYRIIIIVLAIVLVCLIVSLVVKIYNYSKRKKREKKFDERFLK